MIRRIGGIRLAAVLLLAIGLSSCDHAGPQEPVTTTQADQVEEPQELLGLFRPITVQAVDQDGNIGTYELVRQPILNLDLSSLRLSQLIGLEGGTLSLLGHRLEVPSGALDAPALFTMIVLPTGYVQVDVTALTGVIGNLLNIGEQGFARPVKLELSYGQAQVSSRDEDDLTILRLNPRGLRYVHEVMPSTVDEGRETVTTWLDHFSGYCMAL